MAEGDAHPPTRTFKPRRRGLSDARRARFDEHMSRRGIDVDGGLLDLGELAGDRRPIVLDVGCGGGESVLAAASLDQDALVIGVDVHTPGIARMLDVAERDGLAGVRAVHGDVLDLLPRIPIASLDEIRVLFPDPWPKQRQHHRRLLRRPHLDELVTRLVPGGALHVATDVTEYAQAVRRACDSLAELTGGAVGRPGWRVVTRFEARGLAAGRTVTDLRYVRAG